MTTDAIPQTQTRAERLRNATNATHERLDTGIMEMRPFDNLTNYGRFVQGQYALHHDVAPLYQRADLADLIPGLSTLGRASAVAADIADLGLQLPETQIPAASEVTLAQALGWLYVVEGSNLGAAFLFKAAKKLGLSETGGARHLAEAPEGRAAHWRAFREGLNAARLTDAEEEEVLAGAGAAFARARQHLIG